MTIKPFPFYIMFRYIYFFLEVFFAATFFFAAVCFSAFTSLAGALLLAVDLNQLHLEDKSRVGLDVAGSARTVGEILQDVKAPCAALRHHGESLCPTLDYLVRTESCGVRVALVAAVEHVAVDGLALVAYGYVVLLASNLAGALSENLILEA